MPGELNVDQTGEIRIVWIDDKGDTDAPRPDGAQVAFALSDPTIGTVAQDPADPDHATLQPARDGEVNLTTSITDAAGNPLMEPDGTTPFSVPDYALTIRPGAAVGVETEFAVQAAPVPPAPTP